MGTFSKRVFWGNVVLVSICLSIFYVFKDTIDLKAAIILLFSTYNLLGWAFLSKFSRPFTLLSSSQFNALVPLEQFPEGEFRNIAKTFNQLNEKISTLSSEIQEMRLSSEEVLESIGEGVIAVDAKEKVLFMNQAAFRWLKILQKNVLYQRFSKLQSGREELLSRCHEMIQYVLQTSEPSFQAWSHEDEKMYLELSARPRQERRGVLFVIQDKTSHYRVLEMDKDFIANASHELRTPITIIRGFAETLRDHPKLSYKTLNEISEKIVRTSERLEKLIQGLLTLADVEHFSRYRFQTIDLVLLTESCKEILLTAHPTAHISFSAETTTILVLAVPELLDLAIMNLLENGVKYSSSSPHMHLSIQVIDNEVRLEVRDQGIGIPEEDLPYVFDRFYTVDKARSRKGGGTGLGLSLVKTIIEKHRGTVSVASRVGAGSTFTIALPLKAPLLDN